ncbi:CPBP family intramembrane metalloprotease [Cereibacter sphaeroides]|nr:CPBP family intramembrane metalloprotease [Cereibacter sphaeroides]
MLPSYEPLVAPARPRRQLWRTILGFGLIVALYFLWMVGMGLALWAAQGTVAFEAHLRRIAEGADPWSLILLFATFLGAWVGTWVVIHLLHRRSLRSLLGRPAMVLRDFTLGLVMMAVIGGGLTLALSPLLPPLTFRADLGLWLAFLPLALLGVLIQTGAEELVFRGYLQSQLAARFRPAWVCLFLPSALFGLAHYNPAELGENAWIVLASTGLFGLIAADLTRQSGSLGLAWGLHFANNVLAILLVSVTGALDGLSLLQGPATGMTPEHLRPLLLTDMLLMTAVWAACRLWLRRR